MRIGIDARFFGPQETGIGRYVERLVTHLSQIDQRHQFVVFLRAKAWDLWQPPNPRWQKILADYHWYSLGEQLALPGIFNRAKLDLLHIPHFNVPILYQRPFVVTIHDLILDQFPTERATTLEPLMWQAKYFAYRQVVRHAITKARAIITVSEHSKKDLLSRFKIPVDRVHVTYESVDPLPPPVEWQNLAEAGVQLPYILHVGNSYPHKNLERLLTAVQMATQRGHHFQLVLVGKRDYFSKRLEIEVKKMNLSNVIFFGFASDQQLAALYKQAQAYFFPSMSEGFGLPGLEAMQAGTALYAARTSCLPEVFAEAAEYFDPTNVEQMADSIHRALHDRIERQRLINAGNERLKDFSWERMAQQTLNIYDRSIKR